MKNNRNQNKISAKHLLSATILLFVLTVTLFAMPVTNAQISKPTYPYFGINPNPVGVGQETLIHVGTTDAIGSVGDGWEGLTVTVTDPDGKTTQLGPYRTDSTGGTGDTFIPTKVGNYTFQTHFPEQEFGGVIYEASDSDIVTLTVQVDPIEYYPNVPLPTEYWSRPIDSQFRGWNTISGNWLEGKSAGSAAAVVQYNEYAPETPHILWAKPFTIGGLAGGNTGEHGYATGDAYQGKFAGSVIINGVLYYNRYHTGFISNWPQQGIVALDLRTGEELWFKNNTRLAFGQILYFNSYNMHGTHAYLWEQVGTTWNAYNPFNGDWVYTMTNVPSGTNVYGPNGEILRYTVDLRNGWMTKWNSTLAVQYGLTSYLPGSWGPEGKTYDATRGIQWNVSIPTGLPGAARAFFADDKIIGSTAGTGIGAAMGKNPVVLWGIDLSAGNEGRLIFNKTWTPPSEYLTIKMGAYNAELDVFTLWIKETRTHYGFDMNTGNKIWGPTQTQPYQDSYLWGDWHFSTAYGIYYSAATSGIVYAYDIQTGNLLWEYKATDTYTEALWMPEWGLYTAFITDGKIYLYHTEHSVVDPKPRGAPFICLNATSGEEIFRFDHLRGSYWGSTALIGDSIIAFHNTYDQQIYAIGKGPSATTIQCQNNIINEGDSILLEGMVTDISAGTLDYALTSRFPNGVPAVSDESMGDWMAYVYMQNPRPTDVVGVPVELFVIDANENYRSIGVTVGNSDGFFSFQWKPDIPGKYTVYAKFAGSESYWPSHALTAFAVDEAETTPVPTESPPSTVEQYFWVAVAAIIIAIVVIGAILIMLMLKKKE